MTTTRSIDGYFDDCALSQREVAELLGISRTAVYLAEERAFRKLRKAIAEDPQLVAEFPWIADCQVEG